MAGYWQSFFWVFMDRDGAEVHKLAKKNEVNKGRICYMAVGEFFLACHGE